MTLRDILDGGDVLRFDKPQAPKVALAYLRVSTEEQDEEAQRADIERYAQGEGIAIAEWYRDHGASAFNDDEGRAQFRRMVERAKADREVGFILVWDTERFYRRKVKANVLKAELDAHGVQVIPVKTPYDRSTVGGVYLEAIYEAAAEAESMKNRERTLNAMRYNATQRDSESGWAYKNGGRAPSGYRPVRVERGRTRKGGPRYKQLWELDETEQTGLPTWQWVRRALLDWYLSEGLPIAKVVERLNEHGVRPNRSKHWSYSSVYQMLQPASLLTYAGHYVWNKNDMHGNAGKGGKRVKSAAEWQVVENAHPAILTLDEAEAVLARHEARPRGSGGARPRSMGSRFLLSGGLFVCQRCGSNMIGSDSAWGRSPGDPKGRYSYYICGGHKYRRGFDCPTGFYIRQDLIEAAIIEDITRRCTMTDEQARAIAAEVNSAMAEQSGSAGDTLPAARRRLAEVEQQIERLLEALKHGVSAELLAEESSRLQQERAALLRRLCGTAPRSTAKVGRVGPRQVKAALSDLLQVLEGGTNEQKRAVIRGFVNRIESDPQASTLSLFWYKNAAGWEALSQPALGFHLVAPRGFEPRLPG